MTEPVIVVHQLGKIFRQGLLRKRVEALRNVSFEVQRGTIFGFLGPNGAGKTTTIKVLMGLISATAGTASLFGRKMPCPEVMARVGFLPENPYLYPYLTPREFLEMCGHLSGLSGVRLHRQTEDVLARVGISYAADRQVRKLSKGMLQRACLGAALIAEPELLVLDEPMSGLDPVGRKDVHDIILREREAGRTVFFSSHILSDVESMCDQVSILRKGSVVVEGRLADLLRGEVLSTEVTVQGNQDACQALAQSFEGVDAVGCVTTLNGMRMDVRGELLVAEVLRRALENNVRVVEVTPRRETLEDLFVRRAIETEEVASPRHPMPSEASGSAPSM